MLKTPFGEIKIFINEHEESNFKVQSLPHAAKNFIVDQRYQVSLDQINKGNIVDCILNVESDLNITSLIETGEDLALISFYKDTSKLSIGVIGDRKGIKYKYLNNGIRMVILNDQPSELMPMNVAWLCMNNPEVEDIYCWFAADPTIQ